MAFLGSLSFSVCLAAGSADLSWLCSAVSTADELLLGSLLLDMFTCFSTSWVDSDATAAATGGAAADVSNVLATAVLVWKGLKLGSSSLSKKLRS